MRRSTLSLGTISEATLRPEGVIPELISSLTQVAPRRAARYQKKFDAVPDGDPDDLLSDIWDDVDNALNEYLPPFCYFGALAGDGACFGVWLDNDSLEEAIREGDVWKDPDDGSRMPHTAHYRLVVSDHGNMTLYHRNGKEVWGIV